MPKPMLICYVEYDSVGAGATLSKSFCLFKRALIPTRILSDATRLNQDLPIRELCHYC